MLLQLGLIDLFFICFRLVENAREIQPLAFPVVKHRSLFQKIAFANQVIKLRKAHLCHQLAHFLCNKEEIIDNVFRCATEAFAQNRVLRGDANRAGIQVTLAHHQTPGSNQRCCRETKLIRTQKRTHNHVATRFQSTIYLQLDARPQFVENQCLLCLGQTQLPRASGMFQRSQRGSTRSTIITRDRDMIGTCLGNTGSNRTNTNFSHKLHRDIGTLIHIFQIINKLSQILD